MDHSGDHHVDGAGRRPSGAPPYWRRGEHVTWTYGGPGEARWVFPVTVVHDGPDALITWLPVGTLGRVEIRADGGELRDDKATLFTSARREVDRAFGVNHTLRIHEPGRRWSTLLFFAPETGAFLGWYCNIEEPHVRDAHGTYTSDLVLDILLAPDRSFVRKDEDELELAVEQGRYTRGEADAITRVADEVEAVITAWGPPFCDGWERFRPDPAWPVPTLDQVPTGDRAHSSAVTR